MSETEMLEEWLHDFDKMLEDKDIQQHHHKINCARHIILNELSNPIPKISILLKSVLDDILEPMIKEAKLSKKEVLTTQEIKCLKEVRKLLSE